MNVYLLLQQDIDSPTQILGVYATRDMAERNIDDKNFTEYGRYLKRHGDSLGSRLSGNPNPQTFEEWLSHNTGLEIEEHFVVGA